MANGRDIVLVECRHPDVHGLLMCQSCARWQLMELFAPVPGKPVRIRCPRDGCRRVQDIPKDTDPRLAFAGYFRATDSPRVDAPGFCPGFSPKEAGSNTSAKKKRLTKKQKRDAEQPKLFG